MFSRGRRISQDKGCRNYEIELEERLNHLVLAKRVYSSGLNHCPQCIPLCLSLADLEEKKLNGLNKARVILTNARKKYPKEDELWLAAIRIELRHGNKKEAERLMSKALQELPKSGILLATDIQMAPQCPLPKIKIKDALKKNCVKEAYVTASVAKIFWRARKVDKARKYFERTVKLDSDNGDFWAVYYKFEVQHGSEEKQKEVLNRCLVSEPKHGEKWQAVSKALENSHQSVEVILKKALSDEGEAQVEEEQPRNCRRVQVILARPSPSSDEEEDKQVHDSHEYSSKRPNENVGPEGSNDLRNKLRRKSQITDRIHDYNGDLRTIIEESKARKVEDSSARSHLRPRVIDLRDSSKSTPSLSTNWGAYCWTWTLSPTRLIR
ncbi:hypothetical protein F2Q68_00006524 [Brassica cretica]|uniref:Suppressor of forked domain-containing protein n=1 Tax=Brassica cretica TaxID=69181 RepID=A0A8S9JG37_BRACR|nr:hypothetical protein F2Q68_00006524 [Brassica cretica]